ncbi:T. congolense-specific, putative cell surface-expressed gene family [Trypanosoma congolense IL3000]|uniref:T. congolense-specific, putative cell surface-expressed gene family n=1 Tax=Trypanosoma congolense (strain IL3000) TaxID=1068625 RepID=F9WBQ6_TRYCI|nr:T. congolense-specific, putative cell surface-expressed gene family [Trypanosoma congolense IL3000]
MAPLACGMSGVMAGVSHLVVCPQAVAFFSGGSRALREGTESERHGHTSGIMKALMGLRCLLEAYSLLSLRAAADVTTSLLDLKALFPHVELPCEALRLFCCRATNSDEWRELSPVLVSGVSRVSSHLSVRCVARAARAVFELTNKVLQQQWQDSHGTARS